MDNLFVFDDSAKKKIGAICFAPAIAFLITFVYYVFLLLPLSQGSVEPGQVVGITSQNYDTIFVMLAISAIIATASLIYCIVLIAKVRNMPAQAKLMWILILCTFVPITTILFWAMVIRKEPKFVAIYPDMA